jgi:non-ribosomal peptide synthetase component E (peptide arylation enzyme)
MEDLKSITLGQILERGAAQVPNKIAVVDGGLRKSYAELNRTADALAAALADIGIKRGRPRGDLHEKFI